MQQRTQFVLPTLSPWMRNLLITVLVVFVIELLSKNAGLPVGALAWQPFERGFQPWQPLTRYLVQGTVMNFLVGAMAIYFLLPGLCQVIDLSLIKWGVIGGALGGTLIPLLLDLVWLQDGMVLGWTPLVLISLTVLFGLALPKHQMLLFFVLPVKGEYLLWGSLALSLISLGFGQAFGASEYVGIWLGTWGYWMGLGPGARKRFLRQKARKIEDELRRFQVIEGGRAQGDQDPDGPVH